MVNEAEIIDEIKQNPEKGFHRLMAVYREPVYWHIRRLVIHHEDAQDAMQETFIRVFRNFNKFNGISSLRVWIYRIATNEAIRMINKRHAEICSIDDVDANIIRLVSDDEYVDYNDIETVKLQNAILSLPSRQQLSFNMRYYDDMCYDDIAKVIGSTPASVKASYHIAKEKIIKYLNN